MTSNIANQTPKFKAFVIMPFSPEFQRIYEELIRQPLEEVGYSVQRADSLLDQQNILRDIIYGLATADLVVAEITLPNPNVYYELGLAHGLNIPTVMLAKSMDDIPFDLRGYRILIYSTEFDEIDELISDLKEIGRKCLAGEISFGNPITDFYPNANEYLENRRSKRDEREGDEVEEGRDGVGMIEAQEAVVDFVKSAQAIMETINATASVSNAGMAKVKGGVGNSTDRQIATRIAEAIQSGSAAVESQSIVLDSSVDVIIDFFFGFVDWTDMRKEDEREQLKSFREMVITVMDSNAAALNSVRSNRDSVERLNLLSFDVRLAVRRMSKALEHVIVTLEKLEAAGQRIVKIIDDRLNPAE